LYQKRCKWTNHAFSFKQSTPMSFLYQAHIYQDTPMYRSKLYLHFRRVNSTALRFRTTYCSMLPRPGRLTRSTKNVCRLSYALPAANSGRALVRRGQEHHDLKPYWTPTHRRHTTQPQTLVYSAMSFAWIHCPLRIKSLCSARTYR